MKKKLYNAEKWYSYEVEKPSQRVYRTFDADEKSNVFYMEGKSKTVKKLNTDEKLLKKFNEYRSASINSKLNKKYSNSNVMFKFKMKDIYYKGKDGENIKGKEVLSSSEFVTKYEVIKHNLSKKEATEYGFTRAKFTKYINSLDEVKNDSYVYYCDGSKCNNLKITFEYDEFNDQKDLGKIVLLKENSPEVMTNKIDIYDKLYVINKTILYIVRKIVVEQREIFFNRNYNEIFEEELKKHLKSAKISFKVNELRKLINSTNNSELYIKWIEVNFLVKEDEQKKSKLSDFRRIFYTKFLEKLRGGYFSNDDIASFYVNELDFYNITSRVIPTPKYTEDSKKRAIKTYFENNKHNVASSQKSSVITKENAIEYIIKNYEDMSSEIERIAKTYKIEELGKAIESKEYSRFDTSLYGILKDHNKSKVIMSAEEYKNVQDYEKYIRKVVYEYLRGRVNKIVDQNNYRDEYFNNPSYYLPKIEEMLQQKVLEHVIYQGKVELINEFNKDSKNSSMTDKFVEFDAFEKLFSELKLTSAAFINFLNTNNDNKEEDDTEKYLDFLANGNAHNKFKFKPINSEVDKMFRILNFVDLENENTDAFKKFMTDAFQMRNSILHFNVSKFISLTNKLDEATIKSYNESLRKMLDEMTVDDSKIAKALNLEVIYKSKAKEIEYLNSINYDVHSKKVKYLPGFNKLVPQLVRELKHQNINNAFTKETAYFDIVKNAYLYFHKNLYNRMIRSSSFNVGNIESSYKAAQKAASRGEKDAIKKFQNFYIKMYFEKIQELDLYSFDALPKSYEKICEDIKFNNAPTKVVDKKYVIENIIENVEIETSLGYILSIFTLVSDPIVSNSLVNRLKSTKEWLESTGKDSLLTITDDFIYNISAINSIKMNDYNFDTLTNIVDLDEIDNDNFLPGEKDSLMKYISFVNENFHGEEFDTLYYQTTKDGSKENVFRKKEYEVISRTGFDKVYEKVGDKTTNINYKEYNDIGQTIIDINLALTSLNNKLKSFDKAYKKKVAADLKVSDNIKDGILGKYTNYQSFIDDYNKVKEYHEFMSVVNLSKPRITFDYLTKINWKLMKFTSLFERDIHYIIKGLNSMGIIDLSKTNDGKDRPYASYKSKKNDIDYTNCYYAIENDDDIKEYNKLVEFSKYVGLNLEYNEGKFSEVHAEHVNSIRNYLAHFQILQEPFDYNTHMNIKYDGTVTDRVKLIEIIERVDNLMSYRTKYRNAVIASVLEVFKNDVEIDSKQLNKGFYFDNPMKSYERIISNRKVSVLDLDKSIDNVELISKILFDNEN